LIVDHIFWTALDESLRATCGEWHYYYTAIGDMMAILNSKWSNFVLATNDATSTPINRQTKVVQPVRLVPFGSVHHVLGRRLPRRLRTCGVGAVCP